jgi:hypothetical protein
MSQAIIKYLESHLNTNLSDGMNEIEMILKQYFQWHT